MNAAPLLDVRDLQVGVWNSRHRPVDGVSFQVQKGEVFGIVGESGSGKTLTTRAVLQLLPHGTGIAGGSISFQGEELTTLPEKTMRGYRGARISLIPQHAGASLNPLIHVWRQVAAPMRAHGVPRREHFARVAALLDQLGLKDPVEVARSYPHQLSGGMQQRVAAAAALAAEPELLIADEPTSALDPLIQLQFLELLKSIRARYGTAMIFVSHDLGVIARICDRVAVMYGGRVMEQGSMVEIFRGARHPYTQGLLAATPDLARREPVVPIPGRPPLGAVIGDRCPFAPRCRMAFERCTEEAPDAYAVGPGHLVRCWLHSGRGGGER